MSYGDKPASLRPRARDLYLVRWVRLDGTETRHKAFLQEYAARRMLQALLDDGREAALFITSTDWQEGA